MMDTQSTNLRIVGQFFLRNTGVFVRFVQKGADTSTGAYYIYVTIQDEDYYSALAHTEDESKPLFLMMFRQLLKIQSSQGIEGLRAYCQRWQEYRDEMNQNFKIVTQWTPSDDRNKDDVIKH